MCLPEEITTKKESETLIKNRLRREIGTDDECSKNLGNMGYLKRLIIPIMHFKLLKTPFLPRADRKLEKEF